MQSIEYTDWIDHFTSQVNSIFSAEKASDIMSKVDFDKWIFSPGYPIIKNNFTNLYLTEAENKYNELFEGKLNGKFVEEFKSWHTNVKIVFLNMIKGNSSKVTEEVYNYMKNTLKLDSGYNMEVLNIWYQIALATKHRDVIPFVTSFLGEIGRMKYIRPIYIKFAQLDKNEAVKVFNDNK